MTYVHLVNWNDYGKQLDSAVDRTRHLVVRPKYFYYREQLCFNSMIQKLGSYTMTLSSNSRKRPFDWVRVVTDSDTHTDSKQLTSNFYF